MVPPATQPPQIKAKSDLQSIGVNYLQTKLSLFIHPFVLQLASLKVFDAREATV